MQLLLARPSSKASQSAPVSSPIAPRRQARQRALLSMQSPRDEAAAQAPGNVVPRFRLPQFAVSADLAYHWYRTPLAGVDTGRFGASVLGHWYVK